MTSLKNFKDKLFQFCLELAWKHWTKLGISGRERAAEKVNPDPEALILLIGFLGNKDLRLLENVVTWLVTNESLLHKPRLKTVLNVDDLTTLKVLSRIFKRTKELGRKSKWDSLEEYCTKRADGMKGATGRADLNLSQANDISRDVRADIGNNRLLFRKLFGTNTRAELLNFFFCGGSGSSKGIAEYLQLSQSTVHKTLGELVDIGLLTQKGRSRNTSYRMVEGYLSLEGAQKLT